MNPLADPAPARPTPLPNTYWVLPGRLLAGEYPGSSSRATALDRIHRLLDAGVDAFIDLTQDGELAPYEPYLPPSVAYQRWPITDHSLPDSPAYMVEILDALDALLAEDRCVYVHCRAVIGRTGTTIGCHLIRSGLDANAALDRLQTLWKQNARSASWPTTAPVSRRWNP